jgi:histidine kinase
MTIRRRLSLSYLALVIIPVALLSIISTFVIKYYIANITTIIFSIQTKEFNTTLYREMGKDPTFILYEQNIENLIKLTKNPKYTTAYVVIDGELYTKVGQNSPMPGYGDDRRYINSWLFYLEDSREIEFFVTDNKQTLNTLTFTIFGPIALYLILISTLTYFIAKSITTPLKQLTKAAIEIKNEEFDSPIVYTQKDEMTEVFTAFEEMRLKIKSTMERQLKFEENRRELLANISHDLKTPITAIKGYIEGIVDGVANTPKRLRNTTILFIKRLSY